MKEYGISYTVHGIKQFAKTWAFNADMAKQSAIRQARYTLSVTAKDVQVLNVKEIK